MLTSDYGAFAGAAGGPLDEGNLGVVVGVDARPDAEGGLDAPRYVVRACHNGLLHRWVAAMVVLCVVRALAVVCVCVCVEEELLAERNAC